MGELVANGRKDGLVGRAGDRRDVCWPDKQMDAGRCEMRASLIHVCQCEK